MQLTQELFVIPHKNRFIVYAPLKRSVAEVNGAMIGLLKRVKAGEDIGEEEEKLAELRQIGIVTNGETPVIPYAPKQGFAPTATTLIPGLDCNLRCIYCYAKAGEDIRSVMSREVAKGAIDLIIKNALETGETQVKLGFHGGGEPFFPKNMETVRWAVGYFQDSAQAHQLKPRIYGTTNGVMNRRTLEWLTANFDELSISFDGPEDIQNRQRPDENGKGSFSRAMKTIEHWESQGVGYNIRATVTREGVSRMAEIVEFFSSISRTKRFALEPLFSCGRCATTHAQPPDPKDYVKNFILAKEVARNLGRTIHYSGAIVEEIYDGFCTSVDSGFFCVLPEGNITSCLEVCRKSDPRANVFITGGYDPALKQFSFYLDRIQTLRSRNVDSIPHCTNCFAKYNCAGDCPSKCYSQTGSLFEVRENPRCEITRELIKDALLDKMKGGNKDGSKI